MPDPLDEMQMVHMMVVLKPRYRPLCRFPFPVSRRPSLLLWSLVLWSQGGLRVRGRGLLLWVPGGVASSGG